MGDKRGLPRRLEEKRRQVEEALGLRVVIREVRTEDAQFRGRLRVSGERLVVEYQVAQAGYFWDVELIERLLLLALAGKTDVILQDE
jgi:hypothetical protein